MATPEELKRLRENLRATQQEEQMNPGFQDTPPSAVPIVPRNYAPTRPETPQTTPQPAPQPAPEQPRIRTDTTDDARARRTRGQEGFSISDVARGPDRGTLASSNEEILRRAELANQSRQNAARARISANPPQGPYATPPEGGPLGQLLENNMQEAEARPPSSLLRRSQGEVRNRAATLAGAFSGMTHNLATSTTPLMIDRAQDPDSIFYNPQIASGLQQRYDAGIERHQDFRQGLERFIRDDGVRLAHHGQEGLKKAIGWGDEYDFQLGQFVDYIAEKGPAVIVDALAAGYLTVPYLMARTQEVGEQRAINDNRQVVSNNDYLIGAGVAVVTTFSERFGFGFNDVATALGRTVQQVPRSLGSRMLRGFAREAPTEAAEEALEYTATTVNTETGFNWEDNILAAIGGAILGGPMGAAFGAISRGPRPDEAEGQQNSIISWNQFRQFLDEQDGTLPRVGGPALGADGTPRTAIQLLQDHLNNPTRIDGPPAGAPTISPTMPQVQTQDLPPNPARLPDTLPEGVNSLTRIEGPGGGMLRNSVSLPPQVLDAAPELAQPQMDAAPQMDAPPAMIELDQEVAATPATEAIIEGQPVAEPVFEVPAPARPDDPVSPQETPISASINPQSRPVPVHRVVDQAVAAMAENSPPARRQRLEEVTNAVLGRTDLTGAQKAEAVRMVLDGRTTREALERVAAPAPNVQATHVRPAARLNAVRQELADTTQPKIEAQKTLTFMQEGGKYSSSVLAMPLEPVVKYTIIDDEINANAPKVQEVQVAVVEDDGRVWSYNPAAPLNDITGQQLPGVDFTAPDALLNPAADPNVRRNIVEEARQAVREQLGFEVEFTDIHDVETSTGAKVRYLKAQRIAGTPYMRDQTKSFAANLSPLKKNDFEIDWSASETTYNAMKIMGVAKPQTLKDNKQAKLGLAQKEAIARAQDTVVLDLLDYQPLMNNVLARQKYTNQTHTWYNSPLVKDLWNNPNFRKWVEGTTVWWDPVAQGPVYRDFTGEEARAGGLMPYILHHGTASREFIPITDSTGDFIPTPDGFAYVPFRSYSKEKQDSGVGGQDTALGMFWDEDYKRAESWSTIAERGTPHVLTAVVKITNPLVVDYDGRTISTQYNNVMGKAAKEQGHDALILRNVEDAGTGTQVILFEPNGTNVKSPAAIAFDGKVNDFMASIGGKKQEQFPLPQHQIERLEAALDNVGLKGMIDVRLFPFGTHGKARAITGKDAKGLYIALAYDAQVESEIDGVISHEVIHALKMLGFFSSKKGRLYWNVLSRRARKSPLADTVKDNYHPKDWLEETIANMAQQYRDGTLQADGVFGKALKSVNNFMEALGNWVRFNGWTNAETALEYIFAGNPYMKNWIEATADKYNYAFDEDVKSVEALAKRLGIEEQAPTGTMYYPKLAKYGLSVLQLSYNNTHLKFLRHYVEYARMWDGRKAEYLQEANKTVGMWNALGMSQKNHQAVADVLLAMDRMEYLSPEEVAKGVRRHPTREEEIAIFRQHKITAPGIEVYRKARQDFDSIINKMEEIGRREIERNITNEFDREWHLAELTKEFNAMRETPYFPHTRFGQYSVRVRDKDGKVIFMEAFETQRQRKAALGAIKEKLEPGQTVHEGYLAESIRMYQGLPPSMLKGLRNKLNLTQEQQQQLEDLIAQSMPAHSFKKNWVSRNNISGYSADAKRAYGNYFLHGANHMARAEFAPLMQEQILLAEEQIRAESFVDGSDTTKLEKIRQHLEGHLEELTNPREEWAWARQAGFVMWLGFNLKSAVMNFTQVPMVTGAHLGAVYGDRKAAKAMIKTMARVNKLYRNPNRVPPGQLAKDLKLIQYGLKDKVLDESFAQELAALANGNQLTRSMGRDMLQRSWTQGIAASGWMFQTVEKLNRRISFMAAVELARDNLNHTHLQDIALRYELQYQELINQQWDPAEALAYLAGKDSVEKTQFNYSAWARPEMMRGRKSALFTFFMFTQSMLWFTVNDPGKSRYLLMLLATAGLMGLPFAEDLNELAKHIGTALLGRYFNPEHELKKWLAPMMGDGTFQSDLITNGISRYGFGLPMLAEAAGINALPVTDMSANMSMGSPLPVVGPGIEFLGKQLSAATLGRSYGQSFSRDLGDFTMDALGPSLSIPLQMLNASARVGNDVIGSVQQGGPAALSWAAKAYRWQRDGGEYRGVAQSAAVVEYDRNNPEHWAELGALALGFNTQRRQRAWEEIIMLNEIGGYWTARTTKPRRDFYEAIRTGDPEDLVAAAEQIREFNRVVPYPELRIDMDSLSQGFGTSERAIVKMHNREPTTGAQEGLFSEIRGIYPGGAAADIEQTESAGGVRARPRVEFPKETLAPLGDFTNPDMRLELLRLLSGGQQGPAR